MKRGAGGTAACAYTEKEIDKSSPKLGDGFETTLLLSPKKQGLKVVGLTRKESTQDRGLSAHPSRTLFFSFASWAKQLSHETVSPIDLIDERIVYLRLQTHRATVSPTVKYLKAIEYESSLDVG